MSMFTSDGPPAGIAARFYGVGCAPVFPHRVCDSTDRNPAWTLAAITLAPASQTARGTIYESAASQAVFRSVMEKVRKRLGGALLIGLSLVVSTSQVWADVDPFEFQIYGYETLGKGVFDPQMLNSYVVSGHNQGGAGTSGTFPSQGAFRTAMEFEWGLTDKINFAYYLNLVHPSAENLQYAGSKFRLRGRFAEKGELPVDLGWYTEIEWWQPNVDDDSVEAEVMLTAQKDVGDWTFIVNAPDVDKVIVGADRREIFEVSYRAEALYRLFDRFTAGLQFFGGVGQVNNFTPWNQQQQYIAPVIHTVLPGNLPATFGLLVGLTPGSDTVLLKANFFFGGRTSWGGVYD